MRLPFVKAFHRQPTVLRGFDRALAVHRPFVLKHIRRIRSVNPNATPQQVIEILEKQYITAVTAGGAVVGASAAIPGVGFGASLTLSSVETVGFLEASALFAQSVTEVHGIALEDEDRARTLVMSLMLGDGGRDLVRQLASQVAGVGPTRGRFWGELVTTTLPKAAVGRVADRIKRAFIRRFIATQSTNILGRAVPFGIGAVLGAAGNRVLGNRVIVNSREAFGPAPVAFPTSLER